tara:strand:+ start:1664 stop:3520 length:1857 start_codon:yes stop_codon:yes gene_type:complete
MLHLDSISKEFPDKILFKNISLKIKEGMRVGLIGINGSGKSTLLKILLRIQEPDTGNVIIGKDISIGYLPQEIPPGNENTIMEEVLASFPEVSLLEKKIESLTNQISKDSQNEKLLSKLSDLHNEFEEIGGWNIEDNAKKILSGLGFKSAQFNQTYSSFSGGWRMRCLLAGILLKKPKYLFFDEPTNHLDLEAIIWMENFISKWRGGLIMISHDRQFLDKAVNNIYELENQQGKLHKGNYSQFLVIKEQIIDHNKKVFNNQKKKINHTEKFIEKFRYKSTKAKQVQSRIKQLDKIDRIKLINTGSKKIHITIPQPTRGPLKVASLTNIVKYFDKHCVYKNLNLSIERGEKIGLVGPNGAGKTTLLKMLALVEKQTSGELTFGPEIKVHYFAQHQLEALNPNDTVYQSISCISKGWTETQIRSYLGSFLFRDNSIEKKVNVLSGGEKSRLALAQLLVEPAHLLLLDEPTNHLDMQSRDIIEEALKKYSGTLVCISHDRHFLNEVTNLTIEVDQENIKKFSGNYNYYIWKKNNDVSNKKIITNSKKSNKTNYKQIKKKKNALNRYKKRMSIIEQELESIKNNLNDTKNHADYELLTNFKNSQNELELEYLDLLQKYEELL